MSKKQLTDPSQIPHHMNNKEEAEFWSSHEITKEFLGKAERAVAEELPPRSKSISVRLEQKVADQDDYIGTLEEDLENARASR